MVMEADGFADLDSDMEAPVDQDAVNEAWDDDDADVLPNDGTDTKCVLVVDKEGGLESDGGSETDTDADGEGGLDGDADTAAEMDEEVEIEPGEDNEGDSNCDIDNAAVGEAELDAAVDVEMDSKPLAETEVEDEGESTPVGALEEVGEGSGDEYGDSVGTTEAVDGT